MVRRITLQAINARDAGAELIVFTCSATGPSIETARQTVDVPILMIDDPMASKAVRMGNSRALSRDIRPPLDWLMTTSVCGSASFKSVPSRSI